MLTGLYCKRKEKVVSFQECLQCSRTNFECPIFPEYIKWLMKEDDEYNQEITVTKLLYCPRRAYLIAKTDYIINVEDAWALFRGSLSHSFLERLRDENCIVETRFERDYKGIKIYGKPDKIDIENKILYDYKTIAGKISDDYSLRWGNSKLEHQIQLNLYKWLLEGRFEIEKMVLIYIGSDCSKKFLVEERKKDNKKKYKELEKAFHRAEILSKIWNKPLEEITPEELPKEESWICKYCPVVENCSKL